MEIVEITDSAGRVIHREWLLNAEAVHRLLRPDLDQDYVVTMCRVFASGGRMIVVLDEQQVVGLALYRVTENTIDARLMYIEDIVTAKNFRSRGIGRFMLHWLEQNARTSSCRRVVLNTAPEIGRAKHFYLREGYSMYLMHHKRLGQSTS